MPTPKKYKVEKKYVFKDGQVIEVQSEAVQSEQPDAVVADQSLQPEESQQDPRLALWNQYNNKKATVKKPTVEKPAKTEVDAEVSYTTEQPIETGSYIHLEDIDDIDYEGLTLSDLRDMYNASGGDITAVDNYLTEQFNNLKDDPVATRNFTSNLLQVFRADLYDSGKNTYSFGENTREILHRVLAHPEGERLQGWVCSNIHDLVMRYMHKSGMEAAVVSCKSNIGAGHAILVYKSGDGKYTFCNYGHADQVEANNIVEAVCKLQSENSSLMTNGTICFVDEKGSYCKYALEDDAVWGDKIDKSAYNSEIPTADVIPKKSGISVKLDKTNLSDASATLEGTLLLGKSKHTALTGGIGYQTNSNSMIFDSSEGWGARAGVRTLGGENCKRYFGADVIFDYTASQYKPIQTEDGIKEQGAEYLTTFARGFTGIEHDIKLTDNSNLANTLQLSADGYLAAGITLGTSYNGDGRMALEDALKITSNTGNVKLENTLSGGILADMRKTSGAQEMGVQFGSKFNLSSSVIFNPDGELSAGIGVDGYSVFTPTTKDYGVGAKTFINYKPEDTPIVFSGNAEFMHNRQNIDIGGIQEMTENRNTFSASVSAKSGKNAFALGYRGNFDQINKTRNNSAIMVKYTRTF